MKKVILIIDDDPQERNEVKEFLAKEHVVFEAEGPDEVLRLLEVSRVDLIITDYQMPKLNGLEFIKAIRKIGFAQPFFLISGLMDEKLRELAIMLGAEGAFEKPLSKVGLLRAIQSVFDATGVLVHL